MSDVVTFDFLNLRIVEIDAGGDNELDLVEVYSEWKQALLDDTSRLGFPPAFREVGGDPVSQTQSLGTTFFLLNGWKIRPAESHHKLTVNGNLFTDPAGESVFVPTFGAFTVNTETRVSNLIDQVGSGVTPPTATEVAGAVWQSPQAALNVTATAGQALLEMFRIFGLDPTAPLIVSPSARTAGVDVVQDVVEGPANVITVTRV
jgi:hypothetical protein